MRKTKRIITIAVSVLLILVLVTSAGLSSTMAKYVASTKTVTSNTGTVAQWGINITPGTHLSTHYTDMGNGTYKVQTTGNAKAVAPGTRGSLAYIKFSGTPEVAYKIDVSGSINIGYGFWSAENVFKYKRIALYGDVYSELEMDTTEAQLWDMVKAKIVADQPGLSDNEYKTKTDAKVNEINAEVLKDPDIRAKYDVLLRDEKGREIDYFPIAIYLCRYDYDANGTEKRNVLARHCVVRLTPDSPEGMIPALSGDADVVKTLKEAGEETATEDDVDAQYRMSFFETRGSSNKRWASIANMQAGINKNSTNGYTLAAALDKTYTPGTIRSTYVVEWEWAHDVEKGPTDVVDENYEKTRDGNTYRYQTSDLDTQLSEAILKHPELFNITVEFSVVVNQVKTLS